MCSRGGTVVINELHRDKKKFQPTRRGRSTQHSRREIISRYFKNTPKHAISLSLSLSLSSRAERKIREMVERGGGGEGRRRNAVTPRSTRTTTTVLSNARVAFDVSVFSCERFLQSKRVRARFVAGGKGGCGGGGGGGGNGNGNGNVGEEAEAERAIVFVDESSGDSLRHGVGLGAFLELTGCSNVVDMEESSASSSSSSSSMKDIYSVRTGERVAPTAPLVFFIGTTLAESGEKIVRICGERPDASMVTVFVSTCKETQHVGAREVREAFDLCVKDVERLILEKVGGGGGGGGDESNNSNAAGDGEGEQQQKPTESKEEEEDDWDEDWGDDDWEDKQKEKASAALENSISTTASQKVVIQFFPGTIVAPLGPSAFRFPASSVVGEFALDYFGLTSSSGFDGGEIAKKKQTFSRAQKLSIIGAQLDAFITHGLGFDDEDRVDFYALGPIAKNIARDCVDRKDQKIPNEDDELDTLAVLGDNAYETIDEKLRQRKKTCCVMLVDRAMDLASASTVFTDSFYGRIDEVASTSGAFSSLDAEKQTSDESAHRALEEELSRMSFRDACRKVSRLLSEAARGDGVDVESVIAKADAQRVDKNVNNDITSARLRALRQAILDSVENRDGSHSHQWTLRLAAVCAAALELEEGSGTLDANGNMRTLSATAHAFGSSGVAAELISALSGKRKQVCGVSCARAFAYVACGMTLAAEAVSRESSANAAMHQMDVNDSALFMNNNEGGEIFTREDAKAIEEALKCAICECVWNGEDENSENVTFLGKELYDAISEARGYKNEGQEDAARDEAKEEEKESEDVDDGWGNDDDGWSVDDDPLVVNSPSSQVPRVELPDDVRLFLDDFVQDKALFTSIRELIVFSRVICKDKSSTSGEGMMNNAGASIPLKHSRGSLIENDGAFTSLVADIASRVASSNDTSGCCKDAERITASGSIGTLLASATSTAGGFVKGFGSGLGRLAGNVLDKVSSTVANSRKPSDCDCFVLFVVGGVLNDEIMAAKNAWRENGGEASGRLLLIGGTNVLTHRPRKCF